MSDGVGDLSREWCKGPGSERDERDLSSSGKRAVRGEMKTGHTMVSLSGCDHG